MPNPAVRKKMALFSMLILSPYVVRCLHAVPRHVAGLRRVRPLERGKKRELQTVKQPYLGEGLEKRELFCLAPETLGSPVPVEKLCCKLSFSGRRISAGVDKSS